MIKLNELKLTILKAMDSTTKNHSSSHHKCLQMERNHFPTQLSRHTYVLSIQKEYQKEIVLSHSAWKINRPSGISSAFDFLTIMNCFNGPYFPAGSLTTQKPRSWNTHRICQGWCLERFHQSYIIIVDTFNFVYCNWIIDIFNMSYSLKITRP